MKRIYQAVIEKHLNNYKQIVILSGPRTVGKTSLYMDIVRSKKSVFIFNWSKISDREIILAGPEEIYSKINAPVSGSEPPIIIFDDMNLYKEWKNLLKGYYDALSERCRFIATISEDAGTYRRGQDSMMGRYFSYTIHPLTIAEICGRSDFAKEYVFPQEISKDNWNALVQFGGFPEPFQKATKPFHARWSKNTRSRLIQIDIRNLAKVNNIDLFELLVQKIRQNVGRLTNFSQMARQLQTTVPTIQYWYEILVNHYYCFPILPWAKNITRSLLKAPKYYLYDWSQISDEHIRIENLVACHLKKAVDFWNDLGFGEYQLFYLRDKEQSEVNFLIVKDSNPWLMLDVKHSNNKRLNPALIRFNDQLAVPHVFQVIANLPYVDRDCFEVRKPVIVPLLTFLSQLI